jgi:hypothetical protein
MPEWIREKQHVYILPMKGTDGKWQAVDLGYFFPWTQWTEFAADLNPVDTSEMKHPLDLGKVGVKAPNLAGAVENFPYAFGGPLPDLITAVKTNVDPFTGRQIVDPLGMPAEKLSQMFGYLYDMAAPPWLTDRGFAGKMLDAVNSKVDVDDSATRYGSLTPTVGQAAGRLAGVNIYGFDPKLTRAQNIRNMKRKIADLEYRAKRELADKNLSESDREKIKAQVRERRQRIGRELLKYIGKGEGKARPSF